jgi:hypothetical protein
MGEVVFEAKYYLVRMGPRTSLITPVGDVLNLALEALRRAKRVCPEATLWEQIALPSTELDGEGSENV